MDDFIDAAKHEKNHAQAIVAGLARVHAASPGTPFAAARDPRALARAILREPDFAHPHAKPKPEQKTWFDRFWDWLSERFRKLFSGLRKATNLTTDQSQVLGLTLVALAACGAIAIGIAAIKRRVERRRTFFSVGRASDLPSHRPAELLALARARAEASEFGAAIGLVFSAAVRMLDERGIVAYDAARTPGEYRRAVRRAQASIADAFDTVTRGFVLAMYGTETTDALAWATVLAAFERLSA